MAQGRGSVALAAMGALAWAGAAAPAAAQNTERLERKLESLESEVRELKNEILARRAADNAERRRKVAAAAAVEVGDKPGTWKIPGTRTSMQIGGFVRFDGIYDFTAGGVGLDTANAALSRSGTGIGSYDPFFNAFCSVGLEFTCPPLESRAIGALNNGNFRFHARLSRVWFKTWTPTDWGELYTHIAADFLDTNESGPGVFRLRQAFGQLGPFLAGVTESTFRPTFAEAETLDFGGAVGYGAVRKALIRYTHLFGPNTALAIALEDPFDSIGDPDIPFSLELTNSGTRRLAAQRMPDVVASIAHRFPQGQIWVAGLARLIEQDSGGEPYSFDEFSFDPFSARPGADKKFGWGVAVAGTYEITPQLSIGAHGFVGKGIGTYVGLQGDQTGFVAGGGRVSGPGFAGRNLGTFLQPFSAFHDALVIGPNEIRTILSYGGFGWVRYLFTDTLRANVAYGYATQQLESALPFALGGQITNAGSGLGPFANAQQRQNYLTGSIHYMWSLHANLIWSPVPQVDFGVEYVHLFVSRFKGEHPLYFFANNSSSTISRLLFVAMYRF